MVHFFLPFYPLYGKIQGYFFVQNQKTQEAV